MQRSILLFRHIFIYIYMHMT